MKYSVVYNPEFFNDLIQAVDWYNDKQIGLGKRFFDKVRKQTEILSTKSL